MAAENELQKEKKSKVKLIIIIAIVFILLIGSVIGYFLISGKSISDVMKSFQKEEEFTLVLDDFVVNLASEDEGPSKNYLKIQVAMMYTNSKHEVILMENESKIRDMIIEDLRKNSALDMSSGEKVNEIKSDICLHVNSALNEEIVKEVYFSDLLIQ